MSVSVEQFGESTLAAGIMSADELQTFWDSLSAVDRPADGAGLAALLVRADRVTPFQANELLAGRGAGLVFGDYLLLARIGIGGMGEVFKARHRHMKRVVALKIVSPQAMNDAAAAQRFQREVEAAARLEHPNIVTAFDSRQDHGLHYLVMQYVEGSDLANVVKQRGPLPVDLGVQCILQAARGLAYAHHEGIVHRDIKPANLLLDKKGVVKILDMGLARLDDAAAENLTSTEQVMGTVDYMSPEQAASTHAVDARTDIYSLGCTLWFLLVGRKIFEGDTLISRMLKHREAPIPSLGGTRDDVPAELERIYGRMVAKLPEDRYASMDDVVRDLEHLQPGASILRQLAVSDEQGASAVDEFLQGLASGTARITTGVKTGVAPGRATIAAGSDTPTVDFGNAGGGTDPASQISLRPLATSSQDVRRPKPRVIVVGAFAAAGLLAAALGFVLLRGDWFREAPPPVAKVPFNQQQARVHQQAWAKYLGVPIERKNSIGMTLVVIPPGEFMMGMSAAEFAEEAQGKDPKVDRNNFLNLKSALPQHRVVLSKPFWMSATEVTVGQFREFVNASGYKTDAERDGKGGVRLVSDSIVQSPEILWNNPGQEQTDDCPVVQVSWSDAAEFCNWLSRQESLPLSYVADAERRNWQVVPGAGYRLPTEAEWEYACRAGTATRFFWGDDSTDIADFCWYGENSGGRTHPAGGKRPNAFGLFDIQGNVREWMQDWDDGNNFAHSPLVDPAGPPIGSTRPARGGYWSNAAALPCRNAYRGRYSPAVRRDYIGFRVARGF